MSRHFLLKVLCKANCCTYFQGSLCGSAGLEYEHDDQYSAYEQCSDLDIGYWKLWWSSGLVLCGVFSLDTDCKVGHTFSKIP